MESKIHDLAGAAYDAILDAPGLSSKKHLRDTAAGIVDSIVERAETAARQCVTITPSGSGAAVWAGLLESLAECGLTPAIYCTKTGRRLGSVTSEGWADYLDAIASLGDSRAADDASSRLLGAVIADKGHRIAPAVLVQSGASMALMRETSVIDYIAVALAVLFPMPPRSDSLALAQRAEKLGAARAALALLDRAALEYAAETLTLFLAYVHPNLLPSEHNALSIYGAGAGADIVAPFMSSAALGHFCGRLVQILLALLRQHHARPDRLTARDLAALRIHWRGVEAYKNLRSDRSTIRGAMRRAIASKKARALVSSRDLALLDGLEPLPEMDFHGMAASALGDTIDLAFAAAVHGHKILVKTETEIETETALARHAALRRIRDNVQDVDTLLGSLDLSTMWAAGAVPDDMFTTDEADHGLGVVDFGDFDGFAFDDPDDDDMFADDFEDDDPDTAQAALLSFAMQSAAPTLARQRPKPKAANVIDLHGLTLDNVATWQAPPHMAQSATTTPKRRVLAAAPPIAPAPIPAPIPPSGVTVRRVIKKP